MVLLLRGSLEQFAPVWTKTGVRILFTLTMPSSQIFLQFHFNFALHILSDYLKKIPWSQYNSSLIDKSLKIAPTSSLPRCQ